jgi:hypothetical protein
MKRPGSARKPKGECRCHRRRQRAARRPEWVRSYRRAQREVDFAVNRIWSAMGTVLEFVDSVERRPVRMSCKLTRGTRGLSAAGRKLLHAEQALAEARECLGRLPEHAAAEAEGIIEVAEERWRAACHWLQYVLGQVALRQVEVLAGLACGELVAEHPSDSRPRIAVTPRPLQVRAFLASRQHRAADRITSVLRKRRRTPRPAALSVPPRTSQGRAPPFSSTCAL